MVIYLLNEAAWIRPRLLYYCSTCLMVRRTGVVSNFLGNGVSISGLLWCTCISGVDKSKSMTFPYYRKLSSASHCQGWRSSLVSNNLYWLECGHSRVALQKDSKPQHACNCIRVIMVCVWSNLVWGFELNRRSGCHHWTASILEPRTTV